MECQRTGHGGRECGVTMEAMEDHNRDVIERELTAPRMIRHPKKERGTGRRTAKNENE